MRRNSYSWFVYVVYSVILFEYEVLCYPYENVEGGQVEKNIISPTSEPVVTAVPDKQKVAVQFAATANPFSPEKDPRAVHHKNDGTDVFQDCPVVNRQPCGPTSRELCARWGCCWDPNSAVVCAKAKFLMVDSLDVCGSSLRFNPRPRPMTDLKNNLMWLLLGRGKRSTDENIGHRRQRRSVGGEQVTAQSDYPWVARIYENEDEETTVCGASIISSQWVITAARCVTADPSIYTVVVGDIDTTSRDGEEQFRKVIKVATKDFNPVTFDNDIALLKLSSPLTLNDNVFPICIPPQGLSIDGKFRTEGSMVYWQGVIPGFGGDELFSTSDSKLLRYIGGMYVMPREFCNRLYPDLISAEGNSRFCAGRGRRGVCNADVGGGFTLFHSITDKRIYIYGVLSQDRTTPCSRDPAVYVKVTEYSDWIKATISG